MSLTMEVKQENRCESGCWPNEELAMVWDNKHEDIDFSRFYFL